MPAACPIDHEPVKMVALQIGVREAARQFGLDEEMVLKWSQRENWLEQKELGKAALSKVQEERGLSSVVRKTPSEIMAQFKDKSKLTLARVIDKTATGLKRLSPNTLAERRSGAVLNTVSAYAKLYPDPNSGTSTVNVQLLNQVVVPPAQEQRQP